MSIKLLIVDDHPSVRAGLQLVCEAANMEVVALADCASAAIEKTLACDVDVVLLDITLPDGNGLEVLRRIKQEKPKVHVIMYSMHDEDGYRIQSKMLGASGYLRKGTGASQLEEAICRVASGNSLWEENGKS
jgi:DNA-binding NarL/FixJ family response regulator